MNNLKVREIEMYNAIRRVIFSKMSNIVYYLKIFDSTRKRKRRFLKYWLHFNKFFKKLSLNQSAFVCFIKKDNKEDM